MKFYCYIIFSKKLNKFYIGSTSYPVNTRLFQHNTSFYGNKKFTHQTNDWELFLEIKCSSRFQSESIEKHIKAMKNKAYISNLKKYPEMILKLLAKYKN